MRIIIVDVRRQWKNKNCQKILFGCFFHDNNPTTIIPTQVFNKHVECEDHF